MKIEAGKYYKTRDGQVVGPVVPSIHGIDSEWPWAISGSVLTYDNYGRQRIGKDQSPSDLISPAYPEQGTLKEIGAKVGDVVSCYNAAHNGTEVPVVAGFEDWCGYDYKWWRIISRASDKPTSPVRTVTTTRKEVVPGQYGILDVGDTDDNMVQVQIAAARKYRTYVTADELTAAIATLTEIRDALA